MTEAMTEPTLGSYRRIGLAADVPFMEGRNVTVAGRKIAVFNTARGFRAIDAACPHLGGPLADGLVADGCVTCPLHGMRIDLDSGESVKGDDRVRTYRVIERDGELLLELELEPAAELVDPASP